MDSISEALKSVDFSFDMYWKAALLLALGTFVLGVIARFVFGKRSSVNHAVSSAIGILFLYAATVVLYSIGGDYRRFVAALPFIELSGEKMTIFQFAGADYTIISTHILNMIILAFLANLLDSWLPQGKHVISWLFFRILTIALALALNLLLAWLFTTYLPEGLQTYAPTVLLAVLFVMLAVGALKIPIGIALSSVSPVIGLLYTFFFSTFVGKQLSKSILTTLLLTLLVYLLNKIGLTVIVIAQAALIAYIPLLILLVISWYLVRRVL